ncbi:MAG: PilZ domain-containing protein [Acidobacteria bacterium]|nr:PilZ domain-containing protein [Acidobacteriota bacterium]
MKRLVDLTIEDLAATAVWRYEGGTGDEALVVPAERDSLSAMDEEVFLAATEFTLADGSPHPGFCFPVDDSGIDYLQPVIVTNERQVRFWFEGPVLAETLAAQWAALGRTGPDVFPVTFRCPVPVDGRIVTGVIPQIEFSPDVAAPPAPAAKSQADAEDVDAPRSTATGMRRANGSFLLARPVRARQPPRSGAEPGEKRRGPRHPVEMTVDFDQDSSQGTGVISNMSRGGMFVRTPRVPNTGPQLRLTVHLPDGRTLFLKGKVVRSAAGPEPSPNVPATGFGVRLAADSPDYAKFLSQLQNKPK